ncbi:MAG: metallophosphoesterase [Oscillospiraceae bacterium]|nr:metallophosphoesterase [Oscillospiraceae bacterium]
MSIFVTGDTHGSRSYGRFSFDGFMHRFNTESFPEQRELTKTDYMIICGDFGGVWNTDRVSASENAEEKYALDWLEQRSFTTLFVPGNHENYDRLCGIHNERLLNSWFYARMPAAEKEKLRQGYPREQWHGGYVRVIRPSVLMLERGDIFVIDGKWCFAFGGARSHDIQDGILDPADYPNEEAFKRDYRIKSAGMIRVRGISWWDEEMPSSTEREHGLENIRGFMSAHEKLDFVFTHDAPASDKLYLGYDSVDELNKYLESLRDVMKYDKWFYGHLHANRNVMDNHYLLYEQILQIA